jgi:mersacidin/lichenicidin family type 2 lantibiotic
MSDLNVIRAWKDEEYRSSLSAAERAGAPPNPAGAVGISATEQNDVDGPPGSWFACNSRDWMPCSVMMCPTYLAGGIICPIWY